MKRETRRTLICLGGVWLAVTVLNVILLINGWKLGPLGFGILFMLGMAIVRAIFSKKWAREKNVLEKLERTTDGENTPDDK